MLGRALIWSLDNVSGWIGHTGELPGYNTNVHYHPELHTTMVVEVNNDISVGDCPSDAPTLTDSPHNVHCTDPADFVFAALSKEPGKPFDTKQ